MFSTMIEKQNSIIEVGSILDINSVIFKNHKIEYVETLDRGYYRYNLKSNIYSDQITFLEVYDNIMYLYNSFHFIEYKSINCAVEIYNELLKNKSHHDNFLEISYNDICYHYKEYSSDYTVFRIIKEYDSENTFFHYGKITSTINLNLY